MNEEENLTDREVPSMHWGMRLKVRTQWINEAPGFGELLLKHCVRVCGLCGAGVVYHAVC